MAILGVVVLAAVVLLAQCRPQEEPGIEGSWKKKFSAERYDIAKDGDNKPIMFLSANLTVFGDYDRTTDHDVLTNFVSGKLALLEHQPIDSLQEVYLKEDPLPLLFNMTVKELINVGPNPVKNIGVLLNIKLYAKKKKHQEALFALKSLRSSF